MRVFFLIRSLEAGGAERQLVALANGLAGRGHDVAVAVFYGGGVLENDLAPSVKLVDLVKRGRWDVAGFMGRLRMAIRTFRPDVIHGYLGTANILSVLMKWVTPGMKVVWGVRASNMDMSRYDRIAALDFKLQCTLSRFADAIIANSHAGMSFHVNQGMPGQLFSVIPNGIDVDRFYPDRALGRPLRRGWLGDGDFLVGMVARLDPMKDHENLLQAARIVCVEDERVRFVCVGDGDEQRVECLRKRTYELGLSDRLVWAGELHDMVAVYNALDLCCLSSAFGEGFPNVLGEAMSCSVPCVSTDVGDAALVVNDDTSIVPPTDHHALASALTLAIAQVRDKLVEDPRPKVVDRFSVRGMVAATDSVLKKIVDR